MNNDDTYLSLETVDAKQVIHIIGDFDVYSAYDLEPSIINTVSEFPGRVIIDLSQSGMIDSAGMGVLLRLGSVPEQQQRLHLVCPSNGISYRSLVNIGLAAILPVEETLEQALAAPGR